jgi:competence protein ComEA
VRSKPVRDIDDTGHVSYKTPYATEARSGFMKHSSIKSALIAAALLLSASLCLALQNESGTSTETKAVGGTKATGKNAKATGAKAAAGVKRVDINSAGKKELKTLPGISETDADKIIAGRPYLSKAHLTTHNIVSRAVYENLKTLVIAKQKLDPVAKSNKK